jgi:catechol 2,3-dioxygenase-like lactoylglutathione lyase family enzyme
MASSRLKDICFDCEDQRRVARFWSEVLGYRLEMGEGNEPDDPVCLRAPEGEHDFWFNKVPETKVVKNRVHIDIDMPDDAEMQRLQSLGAKPLQEIRDEQGQLLWTVMADPEGNEFCAFPPEE